MMHINNAWLAFGVEGRLIGIKVNSDHTNLIGIEAFVSTVGPGCGLLSMMAVTCRVSCNRRIALL